MSEMYAEYLYRTKGEDAEREYRERCEKDERITDLEHKVALLEAFVQAQRAVNAGINDFTLHDEQVRELRYADAALDWLPR